MKKIICVFTFLLLTNFSLAAGTSSSGDGSETNLYKEAKKIIVRATAPKSAIWLWLNWSNRLWSTNDGSFDLRVLISIIIITKTGIEPMTII